MKSWSRCAEVVQNLEVLSSEMVFCVAIIPMWALYEMLEDGTTVDDFPELFPEIRRRQIRAVLEFASQSLAEPLAT